jgi:hypothetical protein
MTDQFVVTLYFGFVLRFMLTPLQAQRRDSAFTCSYRLLTDMYIS